MGNYNSNSKPGTSEIRSNGSIPFASQILNDSSSDGESVSDALDFIAGTTVAAMSIYVSTTGSDTTGDGTEDRPYATPTKAYEAVPYDLKHFVHIHIAAGVYTDWPLEIDNKYSPGGALSIDATAAMEDVADGPYTIDAGALTALGASKTFDIPVVGGGLTPGDWDGLFVELLDGTCAGCLMAVIENDATTLRVQGSYSMPLAGDTFKVVKPGVEVVAPNATYTINGNTDERRDNNLGILGIKFTTIGNLDIYARNVYITGSHINCSALVLRGCSLSSYFNGPTAFFDVPGYAGSTLTAAVVTDSVGGSPVFCEEKVQLQIVTFLRSLYVTKCYNFNLFIGSVKNLLGYGLDAGGNVGNLTISDLYVEAKSTYAAMQITDCSQFTVSMYVQAAKYGIYTKSMCIGRVNDMGGVDANVTNGLCLENGSRLSIKASGCDLVGATGAGNAIKWMSGAGNSAYPAANNEVNDALGAQVVGY